MKSLNSGLKSVLLFLIVLFALQLSACKNSDNVQSQNDSTLNPLNGDVKFNDDKDNGKNTDPTEISVSFGGSIGDGPIIDATINIYDKNNNLIITEKSSNTADFKTSFKTKGKYYPLTIKVEGGTDIVTWHEPDFVLTSVILSPSESQVNVNPFTTIIVKTAQILPGGISAENITVATDLVLTQLNFGFNRDVVANPFSSVITEENVATMIKASETFGEMLRRTRDSLLSIGVVTTVDDILTTLAHDLIDGVINGKGALFASNQVAALVTATSAQVIIESLSNNLMVEGMEATQLMDSALLTTRPAATVDQLTAGVIINQAMIDQAKAAMQFVLLVDNSEQISSLVTALNGIAANSLAIDNNILLPAGSSSVLNNVISSLLSIDEGTLETFIADSIVTTDNTGNTNTNTPNPGIDTPILTITGSPETSVLENNPYSFLPIVTGGNENRYTFSIANLPSWAHFHKKTGELYGIPASSNIGVTENIVISVSDSNTTVELAPFSITVKNVNDAPTISGTPYTSIIAGNYYNFQPSVYDLDGDTLTFSITNLPKWATFNSSTGSISGTPSVSDVGTYSDIIISVSDGIASKNLAAFSINVTAPNRAPSITGIPATSISADTEYRFQPSASDADGDKLLFAIKNLPSWASFDSNTGLLSGIPVNSDAGIYSNIIISVTDGKDTIELAAFSISVVAVNNPPKISGTPTSSINAGNEYIFQPSASDADNDALTFSVTNLPTWATFDNTSGRISGTPNNTHADTYSNISISVSDGKASASLTTFSITVVAVNNAPTISGTPTSSINASNEYIFQPVAKDADNDTLTFGVVNLPAWATFDNTSGRISGTPNNTHAGTYSNISISVSDGKASASLTTFSITVVAVNNAPTISGTPTSSINASNEYIFQPVAKDADNDALTFNVVNLPAWATFDNTSGRISGTPNNTHAGTYSNISISVSDGKASASLVAFSITVVAINNAPVIWGNAAKKLFVGNKYIYQPQATDADNDPLTFSVVNLPVWAIFDNSDGRLTGTPDNTYAGIYSDITISVTDGKTSVSLPPFTITVIAVNNAPIISGSPVKSINVGGQYSFIPTASDTDNDALKFTVQNLPAWASFDANTGKLYGTPGPNDEGSYDNITISVTDGIDTVSMPIFSILVTSGSGSATLSWIAPTTYSNGTTLNSNEIAGYKVYYGNMEGNYSNTIDINGNNTSISIDNLKSDTYYFVVSTVGTNGFESSQSEVLQNTFSW